MSFWTKKEEVGNPQIDEKEQTFGKQFLTEPPQNGRKGDS